MIHYPDVDNAIHSHLGVGEERGGRTAIHLPLWSDVGGPGGTGAGLAAAVSGINIMQIFLHENIYKSDFC